MVKLRSAHWINIRILQRIDMDGIGKAVYRLWGPLEKDARLHGSPLFAGELERQCNGKLSVRAPGVSKWSFGQQLEHLFLTSHYVLDRMEESMRGDNPSGRIGLWGRGLMTTGLFPRGVFPTIPPLVPRSGTIDDILPLQDALMKRLNALEWDLFQIKASRGRSLHPRMKYLSSSQWLFFQDVHHRHHLAIMRDIVKASG